MLERDTSATHPLRLSGHLPFEGQHSASPKDFQAAPRAYVGPGRCAAAQLSSNRKAPKAEASTSSRAIAILADHGGSFAGSRQPELPGLGEDLVGGERLRGTHRLQNGLSSPCNGRC